MIQNDTNGVRPQLYITRAINTTTLVNCWLHIGLSIVSGTSAVVSDVIGHRDHRLLEMKIIDEKLLNEVSLQAKESPRLRMRSACRFACQRILIFIRVWMRSAIGC